MHGTRFLSLLGLHYPQCKVIKMMYPSIHPFSEEHFQGEIQENVRQYGKNFIVGLGLIAVGIQGNDPVLSSVELKKYLDLVRRCGVKEVVLYRLGGLDKEKAGIIQKHSTPNTS